MTYTGEHLPSVDELEQPALSKVRARKDERLTTLFLTAQRQLKQTGNIPPEALPPSPSLFGCLVKNNVGMAKTILAIVAINSLLVPLAAATDHDSYNAVPAPAPVPSKFATAAAAPTRYAIDEDKNKEKKSILTIVLVVAIAGLGLTAPLVAIVLYERSRGRQQDRHQHRGQAARKITVVRFHSDDEPAGDDCSICLDPYADRDRVGLLPCRHRFHAVCIRKWIVDGVSSTCPTCREVV
eukprot:XP_020398793.1 RING-H2 finger protein ATL14 [Zea mays]